jgi:DNA alkylation repair enzyme
MATQATAQEFPVKLEARSSPGERDKLRRYFGAGDGADRTVEVLLGVRMGDVCSPRWRSFEPETWTTRSPAELVVHDERDLVRKVVGGMLREAGKPDRARLLGLLEAHAATAPRVLLRDAIEHLDPEQRAHYLNLKAQA